MAIEAISKGRSSSRALHRAVSRLLGVFLRFGIRAAPVWVSTKCYPSDAPSRNAPLPLPQHTPPWASHLCQHHGAVALELGSNRAGFLPHCSHGRSRQVRHYYAGRGGLSRILNGIGEHCLSFDPYVRGKGGYNEVEDLELDATVEKEIANIRNKLIVYWHAGIPCSSWSVLQSLNPQST